MQPPPPSLAPRSPLPQPERPFTARDAWALLGGILALAVAWRLSDVLLLAFAGLLVALALHAMSAPLHRRLGLPPRVALVLVILVAVLLAVGGTWLAGAAVAEHVQVLRDTLPRALKALYDWLGTHTPGRWLLATWKAARLAPDDLGRIAGVATGTLNATVGLVGGVLLLGMLGIYLAADPDTYRRGFLRLLPSHTRPQAQRTLDAAGHDLTRWLLGQAVSMLAVAVLTGGALALAGLPLALSLGIIAGVLDFVPYLGPIVSGVLIVAVALTEGESQALWALGICVAVQQAEAYLVQPLVQRWAVRLPPVLGLLAVLVFGLLFGVAGVLLAVPLMVLATTLVQQWSVPALVQPPRAVQRKVPR